jgi:hypothetical protein
LKYLETKITIATVAIVANESFWKPVRAFFELDEKCETRQEELRSPAAPPPSGVPAEPQHARERGGAREIQLGGHRNRCADGIRLTLEGLAYMGQNIGF